MSSPLPSPSFVNFETVKVPIPYDKAPFYELHGAWPYIWPAFDTWRNTCDCLNSAFVIAMFEDCYGYLEAFHTHNDNTLSFHPDTNLVLNCLIPLLDILEPEDWKTYQIFVPDVADNINFDKAETSSKDEPTIHPAPVFRPPPPAAHGLLDEGVAGIGAPPNVLMQALDNLGRPTSSSHIPASKKRKGVDRPVPPPPPQKSKVAYSRPGLPLLINRAAKPKPHPTTWAGIARQAALMPPPPPGLGPQHRRPSPPPPTFPMGLMKTSPHRSVPSFTSEGPTRKQVLVSFGGTPPDLTKFFTKSAVRAANGYLRDGRSMLKVTSIVRAYDGLSLVTPAVASPSDLDILCNFIRESLPTGTPFEVALPSSTSFIKILDVPYFDPKGLKITQEALEKALHTSVHAEVFAYLSTKPRIDRNSAHSTSCTVYCNIWDSQQGTRAKKALGQPIFLAGRSCAIRPAARHTGVPLCQCCWKWGHPTVTCKAKQLSCPICSGPHEQKEHRQHAGCCKGNAKAKPPVPPTPHDQPCPHKGRCVNCHKDHTANLASCKFWAHRYDREWIMAEYRQVHEHAARRQLTNPRT
ncbi:unnamed protein product [Cyclocybe aegerita]|uniref:Gag-like protein n=1 Tax=Cyclocybe aegerita TaxID=1973307 RepID=A0A8S0WK43_CYCAE|nr:unnamed protein product [Cyclocybe aegerita]